MPVVSTTIFKTISDRLSKQHSLINTALKDAGGGTEHFTTITTSNDYNVELDLNQRGYELDHGLSGIEIFPSIPEFTNIINSHVTHITNRGLQTLDQYLTLSGTNVSSEYDDLHFAIKNSHLNSINVFGPVMQMGTYQVTSGLSGVFTDLDAVGTGSGKAGSGNYAAANCEIYVDTGTTIGAKDVNIAITCKKENLATEVKTVKVPTGVSGLNTFAIGIPDTNMYLDISDVTHQSGMADDLVKFRSKLERIIAL